MFYQTGRLEYCFTDFNITLENYNRNFRFTQFDDQGNMCFSSCEINHKIHSDNVEFTMYQYKLSIRETEKEVVKSVLSTCILCRISHALKRLLTTPDDDFESITEIMVIKFPFSKP